MLYLYKDIFLEKVRKFLARGKWKEPKKKKSHEAKSVYNSHHQLIALPPHVRP